MGKKITTDIFIERSKIIHGDKYNYSLVMYSNAKTKVRIVCPKHGVFTQQPSNHLSGNGCPVCAGNIKYTTKTFIEKSKKIHGDKYSYELVNYVNVKKKVVIICPTHGKFEQTPTKHLSGSGCNYCGMDKLHDNNRYDVLDFINKCELIHGDKYDYSLVNYVNIDTPIIILCPTHGKFEQIPYTHSIGHGCPKCRVSKGELMVMNYLNNKGVEYRYEHTFSDCLYKTSLRFDFFLPQYNLCIEYDGIQHFEPVPFFGGDDYLNELKIRDGIKDCYCNDNGLMLLRIRYDDDIITTLDSYFTTSLTLTGPSQ